MTATTVTTTTVRRTPEEVRRARARSSRSRKMRKAVYIFLCWLEVQLNEFPGKVRKATSDLFVCSIVLILFAALFFACLGLLEVALTFWASQVS